MSHIFPPGHVLLVDYIIRCTNLFPFYFVLIELYMSLLETTLGCEKGLLWDDFFDSDLSL